MVLYAYMCARSRGAKTGISSGQVQGVVGGPQASSCEDAIIIVVKARPGALNHRP
jgi:hypothetical protein